MNKAKAGQAESTAAQVLGIPINGLSRARFVEFAREVIQGRNKVLFTTINTYSIIVAQKNRPFFNHFQEAVVLPDGIGIVYAARLLGFEMPGCVSGLDFIRTFLSLAEYEGFSVFFLGSTEENLARILETCARDYPKLRVVGTCSPPFAPFDELVDEYLVAEVNAAKPDALFVGVSTPKQELWLSRNFTRLEAPFMMGVGAAFDCLAGVRGGVPTWLGQRGGEWIHRLITNPGRMWRRELTIPVFLYRVAREFLRGPKPPWKASPARMKGSRPEKGKIELRPYRKGDEGAIVRLFETVFGKTMGSTESVDHWRWEFADNPIGRLSIILAWEGDRLVGQYAANPRRVRVSGEDRLAALSLDTIAHPDYRFLGIFTRTAKACYTAMREQGFNFIIGFPNANSIHGLTISLGWSTINDTPIFLRPVAPGITAFGGGAAAVRPRRGFKLNEESGFGDWADELWERCRDRQAIWVRRDREYLAWRYGARPETSYSILTAWSEGRIAGWIAWRISEQGGIKVLFVMDLLADPVRAADALLEAAINAAAREGCRLVSALVMQDSIYKPIFRRHLFARLPRALYPQNKIHFCALRLTDAIPPETFYDPSLWHISWGDTDVL